ncbi:2-dehydro-3-deoxyphosphogluconate aldolase / (4S)-4-hydroxy-2-oxoglutarate aldolase [Filimonas lacunae]|uniref:2-dehydro-3-deoxyphosphogluconate aldolase / (4S)-4-hydroxy-2-oxoglutarate aldolase n=1 Tax=Filimonas lacunae TaxID=477680 RepID=A0A173MAH2_9BACT|nr:bifunctional 4-hydroxy-2-oxoglutarate aldolase/2-dehydro-3-deoxy-phosphogluconate aldolase [Filimonas lacunae]BAV04532.1 4-hydroxy-2-oxoglutarate aldolase [Filimonas lacunae]SIT31716.1 2-dehydro-3-deoxyphosphogluconate aldolase / (4S)-4-hydroxy-2-oxoglutarate aldolase [Filimonas lacunae]
MSKKDSSLQAVLQQRILPLYFEADTTVSLEVLKALYAAGIRAVEYTNRGAAALDNFKAMKQLRDAELPGLEIGIGTIKNAADARAFVAAGVDFLISPGYVPEVLEVANEFGLLYVPGCMTPTEIITAENAGIRFVKLFPGNVLGPGFVEAIRTLFPAMYFMPTGGVELDEANLRSWFTAGVNAVGLGSKLINKKVLAQADYAAAITAATATTLHTLKSI